MSSSPTEIFTLRVAPEVAEQIRRLAEKEDRSASSVIRLAVREYLERTLSVPVEA